MLDVYLFSVLVKVGMSRALDSSKQRMYYWYICPTVLVIVLTKADPAVDWTWRESHLAISHSFYSFEISYLVLDSLTICELLLESLVLVYTVERLLTDLGSPLHYGRFSWSWGNKKYTIPTSAMRTSLIMRTLWSVPLASVSREFSSVPNRALPAPNSHLMRKNLKWICTSKEENSLSDATPDQAKISLIRP